MTTASTSSRQDRGAWRFGLCLVLAGAPVTHAASPAAIPGEIPTERRLAGLDTYIEMVLKDWNAPGVSVGVVVKDKLVLAKGYGYRDVGTKLPMTPKTLAQFASNTKLFTAVGAGLLVEEGKLEWDEPIRRFVPSIRFSTDDLNRSVTLRDMLAHRTGITRHDSIWYKSPFTRKELFEKLKHLEPATTTRQTFLYNNLMYTAVGYIVELLSGKAWEDFTRERIFKPLGMDATVFTLAEMRASPDHGVPYRERRDSAELFQTPFYEEQDGFAPAGAIVSNVEDMSRWLIALMNEGRFQGREVLPPRVLEATLAPAMPVANEDLATYGYSELLSPVYGMGRYTAVYRGHAVAYHGGALGGFYSRVSYMPHDGIGVIALVDGGHCGPLADVVSLWIYERLLGLDPTPWSERRNEVRLKSKKANREARDKAGSSQVKDTRPSHALSDYEGEFEHRAYGILRVTMKDAQLQFDFNKAILSLKHYHYDRFDTTDDELRGKFSLNFLTNPQGEIDKAVMSLDESEVTFTRKPDPVMSDPKALAPLAGTYERANGTKFEVVVEPSGRLVLVSATGSETPLIPVRPWIFGVKVVSDVRYEFLLEDGKAKGLKLIDPTGEFVSLRK
jgi:CubicO group peptidase (beta-lactamase class C family)